MGRPLSIIINSKNYQELSKSFFEYQVKLGYVKETCRTRQLYVNEFLSWLECKGINEVEQVKSEEIQGYYSYIKSRPSKKDKGQLSPKTTFEVMKTIELLFTMLQAQRLITIDPTSTLKLVYPRLKMVRQILSQEEINELYEVCENHQERSILSLAYGCGLRAGELDQLNIEDVKLKQGILIIVKGKGNKRRVIPMSSGVVKDLEQYYLRERGKSITQRKNQGKEHAFMLNSKGRRMRRYTYNKHLRELINRTNNQVMKSKEISVHNLRHSIASHLLEQGLPVEQVRQFLGHSQLETTQMYTRVNKQQLKDLVK